MNTVYASTYLYLAQFLSSVCYSFPSTSFLPPWLNLFLGTFYFVAIIRSCGLFGEDGGNIGGSGVHFPSTPGKYLADLRSRANSQQYSSIYKDQRPKIEDIERSDGKKSA